MSPCRLEDQMQETLEKQTGTAKTAPQPKRTPWGIFVLLALGVVALMAILFVAGYLPRIAREKGIQADAHAEETNIPIVNVAKIKKSPPSTELLLPGSMIPVTEAYIFARVRQEALCRYWRPRESRTTPGRYRCA